MPPRERRRPASGSMLRAAPEPLMTAGTSAATPAPTEAKPQTRRRGPEIVDPVFLSARVPRELRDALQRQAIAERTTVGQLLQLAVTEYLDRQTSS